MLDPVGPDTALDRVLDARTARTVQRGLGCHTVKELIDHFPRDYMPHNELSEFSDLRDGDYATFIARVVSTDVRELRSKPRRVVDVVVTGATSDTLTIGFFGGAEAKRRLTPGTVAMFYGKVRTYRNQPTLTNPGFDVLSGPTGEHDPAGHSGYTEIGDVVPLYPASAEISSRSILRVIRIVLDQIDFSLWSDPLPENICEAEQLPDLGRAYELVHRPENLEDPEPGWRRFRFTEALLLQGLMDRRRRLAGFQQGVPAPGIEGGRLATFDRQLEFRLTEGQRRCGELISQDLARQFPMNRLLQGEVGSGKTLVALRAMLQVIDSGAQAALVAPTEVLASQHMRSIQRMLGPLADQTRSGLLADDELAEPLRIVMLTGSHSTAERRQILLQVASGEADLVIGTHAVLGDKVQFAQLGLAVVDEQHRFGVSQRSALREKHSPVPHMLVMSATPIPRSVAMTAFGDLELTVLKGLPAGRSPIDTHVVPTVLGRRWQERVWERVAEEVEAGQQVYVVCPKIKGRQRTDDEMNAQLLNRFGIGDGSTSSSFSSTRPDEAVVRTSITRDQAVEHIRSDASIQGMEETFASHPVLSHLPWGTLHGQLPPREASAVMDSFESGRVRVLLATTVVEVGVDVPAATLMVILDAEAFGVSTLHQLRGRIGRGHTSNNQCLLVTRMPTDHPSVQRLHEVAGNSDGMQLALLDLKRRREGDVLGSAQSGAASTLKLLRVIADADLIESAADHIRHLSSRDPEWASAPRLWQAVEEWRLQHHGAEDYVHQS